MCVCVGGGCPKIHTARAETIAKKVLCIFNYNGTPWDNRDEVPNLGVPDHIAGKNTGCSVKFEFQV